MKKDLLYLFIISLIVLIPLAWATHKIYEDLSLEDYSITNVDDVEAVSFTGENGEYIGNPTDGQLWFTGTAGNYTNTLKLDFDATSGRTSFISPLRFHTGVLVSDSNHIYFGNGADFDTTWVTTGNDHMAFGLLCNSANYSGYLCVVEKADLLDADRSPSGTTVDPTLRIYSADDTEADDYVELYHNQTNGVIDVGNGVLSIPSDVTLTTGKHLSIGTTQWDDGSDKMDGEQIADNTIDEDSPDWGTGAGQIYAAHIELLHQATATYDDVQDLTNTIFSAGRISGGGITDDGDGTITVAAGTGMIKQTDDNLGATQFINWSQNTTLTLIDASMNHIYAAYNGGSPVVGVTANESDIDEHTEFELGHLYKDGTTLYPAAHGVNLEDFLRYVHNRAHDFGHIRGTGIIISDAGGASRNINLTEGTIWAELTPITISAQTPATFTTWYHSSGAWTSSTSQTVINNTQYDNGTDLATLTTNRYGVHWVYISENDTMHVVFGRGDYKLIQAEGSTAPSLPEQVSEMGMLIGRIIIQKSATAFTETTTAFETTFGFTGVTDHVELANLQGGTTGEYYHITSAEHTELNAWLDDVTLASDGDTTVPNLTATSVVKAEDIYSTDDARITDEIQDGNGANGVTVANIFDKSADNLAGDISGLYGATAIGANKVTEAMLKAVNAAVDEYDLSYESTTGDFEWHRTGRNTTGYIDLPYGEMFSSVYHPLDPLTVPKPNLSPAVPYTNLYASGDSYWYTTLRIPSNYDATADTIVIKFSALKTADADTVTIDVVAAKRTGINAVGGDLITTAAQTITQAEAVYTFDMSSGSLSGGDLIIVSFSTDGIDSDAIVYDNFRAEYTQAY